MQNTTKDVNGTHAVFVSPDQRGNRIRAEYMLQAMYSCETTPAHQTVLSHLTTAFVNSLQGHNHLTTCNQRSATPTLTAHQPKSGDTNDPNHPLLNSRVSALRRAWHNNIPPHPLLTDLHGNYQSEEKPSTVEPDYQYTIPYPRNKKAIEKHTWKTQPNVPVGLLPQTANTHGTATIRIRHADHHDQWMLRSKRYQPTDILNTPLQHLHATLKWIHLSADMHAIGLSSPSMIGSPEIDVDLSLNLTRRPLLAVTDPNDDSHGAIKRLNTRAQMIRGPSIDAHTKYKYDALPNTINAPHPKAPLLRAILCGELWSIHVFFRAGLYHSNACILCQNAIGTVCHTTWYCP